MIRCSILYITGIDDEDENSGIDEGIDYLNEKLLWLVQRVDGDVNQDIFLVLNDE